MDYLQYFGISSSHWFFLLSFKPYYKWITFNTLAPIFSPIEADTGFKPYYKCITFNTKDLIFLQAL